MSNRITKRLTELAVYWARKSGEVSEETGQVRFEEPVEIPCRWFDTSQTLLDEKGNQVVSKAYAMVDREVTRLGVLWLPPVDDSGCGGCPGLPSAGSALAALTDATNPFANDNAFEIRSVKRIKMKDGSYYREAWM